MKKLIVSGLVVISLIGTSILAQVQPAFAAEQKVTFTDIKGHWAKAAIDTAVSKGYFKGYSDGAFKPNGTVTRAEFAALLARASKSQVETERTNVFPDLAGHWSESEVNRAVSLGYIQATDYPNGFKPSTPITRMEIAKWMALGLAAADADYKLALQDTVTTVLPVKEYFKPGIPQSQSPYIAVSLGTKLMSGYPDGSFGMKQQATRAEASAILLRLDNVSQQPASSFVGLNELREVGTKRTNMESISPFTTGDTSLNNVAEKTLTFRNYAGTLQFHHFIVVDTQDFKNQKGIYAPLFVDKRDSDVRFNAPGIYRAYVQITIYPKTEGFSIGHYYNGVYSDLVSGQRVRFDDLQEKYGYLTLPYIETAKQFSKYKNGKGVTLWVQKFVKTKRPISEITSAIKTDDGSYASIRNQLK